MHCQADATAVRSPPEAPNPHSAPPEAAADAPPYARFLLVGQRPDGVWELHGTHLDDEFACLTFLRMAEHRVEQEHAVRRARQAAGRAREGRAGLVNPGLVGPDGRPVRRPQ